MYAKRIARLQAARDGVLAEIRGEDYQLLCLEYYGGSFPLQCEFCGGDVNGWGRKFDGAVHHLDHDRRNNAKGNLFPVHGACHSSYHGEMPRASLVMTEEHRRAIGDGVRGTKHSTKARRNMSRAAVKKYSDPENRRKQSEAMRASWERRRAQKE